MIKLSWIAEVILNIYYAGRPKEGKKLDIEDFEQMVRFANATIMRRIYFELRDKGEEFYYFGFQLEQKEFELPDRDKRGRRILVFPESEGIIRLPMGLGVFNIYPITEDESIPTKIHSVAPGTNSLFSGEDFNDLMKYENRGSKITFYNVPDCVKSVEIDGIFGNDDMEVPMDIAIDIVNIVLVETLKTINVPIDKTNDGDPNLLTYKARLAEKQSV